MFSIAASTSRQQDEDIHMADNFLEKHYEDYERRKAEWLRRKRHLPRKAVKPQKPEDEAL